jgi:hypothetical protein
LRRRSDVGDTAEMDRIRAVKEKHEKALLRIKNVVGVGIGLRQKDGQFTDQVVLTVIVQRKHPASELARRDRIPSELDGIPVDVQEVGTLRADEQRGDGCYLKGSQSG